MSVFGAHKIIQPFISEPNLSTYLVGFDLNDKGETEYRLKELTQLLLNVIPEFSFGFHEGTSTENENLVSKVSEAAKAIYNITEFSEVNNIYMNGNSISDDDIEKKFLRRGEFGELILHLLLREFHSTIPLLSKIYFKDSYGHTVHGFDAIHIQPNTKTLWLGESKLYTDGKKGVSALIGDIMEHFKKDYLDSEFMLVSKKVKHFNNIPEKNYWLDLLNGSTKLIDQLNSINIPLLCTYSSENFNKYNDETCSAFISEYEKEIRMLQDHFYTQNNHPFKTKLNIILLLFPVKCKVELVKSLHKKLYLMQLLGD
ncbi:MULTISPECIES: HamA C-terminal domain-containing protein [Bacillus cereus group]|uniref:HamA C-terminal domain-containing protein n=1 Tax=Bacillus cereus group TaxID=86661 RepID=UPI0007B6CEA6|nr:DUF1837 domain-containing protein [Bacillus cereus]ANC11283.1 hypothetical protein WR47_29790 [Bacillus cereus]ANC16952.1 hypothetical protein WR51_28875 [Bacillus cereus]MDA1994825.1 DUF1837 domain-containing protein [Bacillus cereus]MDA2000945.1 DUF1837 domain-containing protein [Bacillus cereus]MDA3654130.1 DUF1837 domain-containing protein [Bacillus cereus]